MKIRKGFTLIELLIVIAIIGTLAVLFVPRFLDAPSKSRDAERVTHLTQIRSAIVQAQLDGADVPAGEDCAQTLINAPEVLAALGGEVPLDPDPAGDNEVDANGVTCEGGYTYISDPDGNGTYAFGLYAKLENLGQGNVDCEALAQDAVDLSDKPDLEDGSDSCYAMLVN
jgi:prepilin-type N-terminal cleavage/methylation domain-containing protein